MKSTDRIGREARGALKASQSAFAKRAIANPDLLVWPALGLAALVIGSLVAFASQSPGLGWVLFLGALAMAAVTGSVLLSMVQQLWLHRSWRPPGGGAGEDGVRTTNQRRGPLPVWLVSRIHARDGGQCVECGQRFDLQVDHIIPVAMGGSDAEDNLRLLCRTCNQRKGPRL